MAYRGEDLDLRTLQASGQASREQQDFWTTGGRAGGYGTSRSDPIWIDELLLTCCNDAFEIATVHRAGEVRLEHLLNAMTRLEQSAAVLEQHGVRVGGLRRETAAAIAGGAGTTLANGKGQPRTADEIEQVLRSAAEISYQRRSPVSVDDVVTVLLEGRGDLPGLSLFRRHAPIRGFRDTMEPRYEGLSRPVGYASETRGRQPLRPAFVHEPARPRAELPQAATDSMQNSRIDTLERAVRELTQELGGERKAFNEVQRELTLVREDSGRLGGSLTDRLQMIEQALIGRQEAVAGAVVGQMERQLADLSRVLAAIGDRLAAVERGLDGRPDTGALPAIVERLGQVERAVHGGMSEGARNWAALGERLKGLEKSVATRPEAAPPDLQPVIARLAGLERLVQSQSAPEVNVAPIAERLAALERVIAQRPATQVDLAPVTSRIEAVGRALEARASEQDRAIAAAGERARVLEDGIRTELRSMVQALPQQWSDQWSQLTARLDARQAEAARLVGDGMRTDLKAIAQTYSGQAAASDKRLGEVAGEIKSLSAQINAQAGAYERALGQWSQRFEAMSSSLERARAELGQPVAERLGAVSALIERRHAETTQWSAQNADRLTSVDGQLARLGQHLMDVQTAHAKDLVDLHDALVKINANQQTLAQALDQWRLDATGDLSIVGNRLEALEAGAGKPIAMMERLSADMQSMYALALNREARKSRFKMWLFGTEDWLGSGWRRQARERPSRA
jgi:hypothetical protein